MFTVTGSVSLTLQLGPGSPGMSVLLCPLWDGFTPSLQSSLLAPRCQWQQGKGKGPSREVTYHSRWQWQGCVSGMGSTRVLLSSCFLLAQGRSRQAELGRPLHGEGTRWCSPMWCHRDGDRTTSDGARWAPCLCWLTPNQCGLCPHLLDLSCAATTTRVLSRPCHPGTWGDPAQEGDPILWRDPAPWGDLALWGDPARSPIPSLGPHVSLQGPTPHLGPHAPPGAPLQSLTPLLGPPHLPLASHILPRPCALPGTPHLLPEPCTLSRPPTPLWGLVPYLHHPHTHTFPGILNVILLCREKYCSPGPTTS